MHWWYINKRNSDISSRPHVSPSKVPRPKCKVQSPQRGARFVWCVVYYWFILKALTNAARKPTPRNYLSVSLHPSGEVPLFCLIPWLPSGGAPAAIAAARHATPATRHATGLVRFLSLEVPSHPPRPTPQPTYARRRPMAWMAPAPGTCGGRRSAEGAMANGLPCLILIDDRSPARQVAVCMQPAGSSKGQSRITIT